MNPPSSKWRGEESGGGEREVSSYVEEFLKVMAESDYLNPFQKHALLKFGIANEDQAKTLYQASFHVA